MFQQPIYEDSKFVGFALSEVHKIAKEVKD